MKAFAKEIVPESILSTMKRIRLKIRLDQGYKRDSNRFYKYASLDSKSSDIDQVRGRITYYYHALEKGMSHKDIRFGFGKTALKGLYDSLSLYNEMNYTKEDSRYLTALSVLQQYIDLHEQNNINIDWVKELFADYLSDKTYYNGGVKLINSKSRIDRRLLNFKDLSESRVSIREFSPGSVDQTLIFEAISIAMKTPSVCNRQPWKVYVINNDNLRNEVLKHQKGFKGNEKTDFTLLMITTDVKYFLGVNERNQAYIDGGLFSMSLLYALEHVGLGACALNASLKYADDNQIRKATNISDSENIIMFIAVGLYPFEAKVPKSARDKVTNITTILTEF